MSDTQAVTPQLGESYFAALGVPETYAVDVAAAAERYRRLQREFHPDRWAAGSDAERRQAVQLSAYLNEAFETLRSPLLRARYLLERQGMAPGDARTTADMAFLMQQMEWRERLAAAADEAALDALSAEAGVVFSGQQVEFARYAEEGDWAAAAELFSKMQFSYKLLQDIEARQDAL